MEIDGLVARAVEMQEVFPDQDDKGSNATREGISRPGMPSRYRWRWPGCVEDAKTRGEREEAPVVSKSSTELKKTCKKERAQRENCRTVEMDQSARTDWDEPGLMRGIAKPSERKGGQRWWAK